MLNMNNSILIEVLNREDAEIKRLEKLVDDNGEPVYRNLRKLYDFFKPKEEDLKRTYTNEELKELCLRVKCKVSMDMFNPVDDFARRFRREGRLQNRSKSYANRLLTKAVMKHKSKCLYSQEEIDKYRDFMYVIRKKENNLLLDRWKRDRERMLMQTEIELSQVEPPLFSEEILTQNSNTEDKNEFIRLQLDNIQKKVDNSESYGFNNNISQNGTYYEEMENGEIADWDPSEDIITDEINTQELVSLNHKTVKQVPRISETDLESLFQVNEQRCVESFVENIYNSSISSQINDEVIKAGLEVNTESLSLRSEDLFSQSEPIAQTQSQNLPYEEFNTQIPLTSTQSQSQTQNEIAAQTIPKLN